MVSLREAETGRCLHPVEENRIVGMVSFTLTGLALHALVLPDHAGNHGFRFGARTIDRHHGRETGPLEALQRVSSKVAVLPDAVPNARFAELEQNGRHTADEERDGILEDAPGD